MSIRIARIPFQEEPNAENPEPIPAVEDPEPVEQ